MISDLISLIFPQNCINCQRSLIYEESFICTACKIDLPITNDHLHQDNDLFKKFAFEAKIMGASSYLYFYSGGITKKLLHQLKYKGKEELGVTLGEWYGQYLKELEVDFILPVPLHRSKRRKRGYNQSQAFAKGISKILGVEVTDQFIKREVSTSTQTKKSKVQRWLNLENVYSEANSSVKDKKILVVDDVITTGATVGMLCDRLVKAECGSIYIASIARGK